MTTNQDNNSSNQGTNLGEGFSTGGDEFVFTEEKKPINRNMVVLLLIAVVGAALIYMMYLRGKGQGGADDPTTAQRSQQVAEFMKKSEEDLKTLDQNLQTMQTNVDVFTADNGAGQVKTKDLKTNPFQFEKQTSAMPLPGVGAIPEDPKAAAAKAAAKVEIQMITFAAQGSNCILNNKLCSEGDQITVEQVPFTVKQIAKDYVMLQNKFGEFKLVVHSRGL